MEAESVRPRSGLLYRLKKSLLRALAAIGLLTIVVIATPIDVWWAHGYAGSMDQPRGDVLIVLSAANDDQGFISYSSYWRARYALLAWRRGGFRTIVVSGGGAQGIGEFLAAEGIPSDALILERQSASTRENATDTARLIAGIPGKKVLLTSDFHMFRAIRVFRKLGMDLTPYPAPDVMKISQHWEGRVSGCETLVIETAKIAYYRLRGWI